MRERWDVRRGMRSLSVSSYIDFSARRAPCRQAAGPTPPRRVFPIVRVPFFLSLRPPERRSAEDEWHDAFLLFEPRLFPVLGERERCGMRVLFLSPCRHDLQKSVCTGKPEGIPYGCLVAVTWVAVSKNPQDASQCDLRAADPTSNNTGR